MISRLVLLRGSYYDSVTLMLAARDAESVPGVVRALALACTPVNRELIAEQGFDLAGEEGGPNDVVLALRGESEDALSAAHRAIEGRLSAREATAPAGLDVPHASLSLRATARGDSSLNLAFISVPGRHAAYEVSEALEAGLHVFCFSSGVPVPVEASLKQRAVERELLLMGPDCGTAIVDGVGLGFSNAVQRGAVGIVAASGTGTQEVTCLLDAAGVGISQAIGVGSHDLSVEVGGVMTLRGLELLAKDDDTEVLVVLSKPPDPEVARRVREAAATTGKPTVACFLGLRPEAVDASERVVGSLEEAASLAAGLLGRDLPSDDEQEADGARPGHIRGLFSGGSLCIEAMSVVSSAVGPVASNVPLDPAWRLEDVRASRNHSFIDFGEEEFTEGRLHPMVDPSLRNERFRREASDRSVAVILLDVVLGFGAHQDPSGELAPLIREALGERPEDLTVVVSVCGTPSDVQDASAQAARLREAGAMVTRSAAGAARLALRVAGVQSQVVERK